MNFYNKAFTLVELAIVIIIIGLITGGVVGAQSLIRSANINSAIRDIERMNTAIKAFELEYDATPGMMEDAFDYFGSKCGFDTGSNNTGCNGDYGSDGCVNNNPSSCAVTMYLWQDIRRFFMHLNVSGIYPELPAIIADYTDDTCALGVAIPTPDIGGVSWVSSESSNKLFMYFFEATTVRSSQNCYVSGFSPSLTAKDARKIDVKLDDGNGRSGSIHASFSPQYDNYSSNCLDANGVYLVSDTDKECGIRAQLK